MYTLFWHPWSSSYAPMAVLRELGVDFELYEVDYAGGETKTTSYREKHPLGLIPALGLEDGRTMFESAAMIIYLCDRQPEAGLAPHADDPDRADFLQWMLFLAGTVYPAYNRYSHPERFTADPAGTEGLRRRSLDQAMDFQRIIEKHLSKNGPLLLGERFSAADIYLQMITTWHGPRELLERMPSIRDLAGRVMQREPCRWAAEKHNFSKGLEP